MLSGLANNVLEIFPLVKKENLPQERTANLMFYSDGV